MITGLIHSKTWKKTVRTYRKITKLGLFRIISDSLESLIPVLLISAFIQVLINYPVPAYQSFIKNTLGGQLYTVLEYLEFGTYGLLSVYMALALSDNINNVYGKASHRFPVLITSFSSFMISSGILSNSLNVNLELLGPKNILCAIVCAAVSSYLLIFLLNRIVFNSRYYVDGISMDFVTILYTMFPMILVLEIFVIGNLALMSFGYASFYDFVNACFRHLFNGSQNSLSNMFRFELVNNLLWAVGIHGADALADIKYQLFDIVLSSPSRTGMYDNGRILSGAFIDVFVLLGGCGSTWSLILAMLIFGKNRNDKILARTASVPMIFNINELVVFGLPVVLNPVLLIPFVLTPIINICVCYFAMSLHIVPIAQQAVNWTTPVLIGGYMATGSVRGSILQVVCIAIGVFIYAPFVMINDRIKFINSHEKVKLIENILKECEETRKPVELLTLAGEPGRIARTLAAELNEYIDKDNFTIHYQPQYNENHELIGAEALLRWIHPQYGLIYPPLVIALADELHRLTELEEKIFLTVFGNMDELFKYGDTDSFHVSVNVTGITIQTDEFESFLKNLHLIYGEKCSNVLIEITEQATLKVDDPFIARLTRIKDFGFTFGIDDFSMGNTSIKYLQSNIFDIVKLDGGISRDVLNIRSREIISSIAQLTSGFNIDTVAEYVETEAQRMALEDVGCYIYQGYLYSPAIPLSKFPELKNRTADDIAAETNDDY